MMGGGPINGVSWAAMSSLAGMGGIVSAARRGKTDPNDPVEYTGIIVPTMLQMATDVLSYWTSMTCLYDRYRSAEDGVVTLPIALFHVLKITPTYSNEVSKKRVILYEPQNNKSATEMADAMREGVMQTIADNVVKNPKTYNVEVIVPFQPIGRYVGEGIKTLSDMVVGFSDLLGGNTPGGFTDWWEGIFSSVFALIKTASTAADFAGKLPGMDGVSFINMNSLEAMADSGRVLCMKMWTGYDYKFVVITNFSYDKQPKEDGVFRGTIQCQEVPILQVTRPSQKKASIINRNWAVTAISAVQGTLTRPLIWLTQVEDAAGGSAAGGGSSMVKSMLGL
jgi:hypothetical protein